MSDTSLRSLGSRDEDAGRIRVHTTTIYRPGESQEEITSTSSWIEGIQFKADFQHYRSNNYASLLKATTVKIPSRKSSKKAKASASDCEGEGDSSDPPSSFCWHFPKVSLGRIFNAKSLDDILGRGRKGENGRSRSQSQSNSSISKNSISHSPAYSSEWQNPPSSAFLQVPGLIQPKRLSRYGCTKSDNCLHQIICSQSKVEDELTVVTLHVPNLRSVSPSPQKEPLEKKPLRRLPSSQSDSTVGKMTKDMEAKLVVANVAYIQRPSSPFRVDFSKDESKNLVQVEAFKRNKNRVGPDLIPLIPGNNARLENLNSNMNSRKEKQNNFDNFLAFPSRNISTDPTGNNLNNPNNTENSRISDTGMGDLQSPQYVKRTANYFNSKYPNQVGNKDERQAPSYLNVSRSVCGYTCLSYNKSSGGGGGPKPPQNPIANLKSDFVQRTGKRKDGENRVRPILPSYEEPCGNDAVDSKAPSTDKSFIMQKIERLYGTEAIASGFFWRRTGRGETNGNSESVERIIPIEVEAKSNWKPSRKPVYENESLTTTPGVHSFPINKAPCTPVATNGAANGDGTKKENGREIKILHVNKNFKDLYDIGSSHGMEEASSAGLCLFEKLEEGGGGESTHSTIEITGSCPSRQVEREDEDVEEVRRLLKKNILCKPEMTEIQTMKISEEDTSVSSHYPHASMNKENEDVELNGEYFLKEMGRTKEEIIELSTKASEELEILDPNGEEAGKLRAAIGKANLLIVKKFKQFEELCYKNLEEQGVVDQPFITKNEDLAGFWDMVLIQVDQIHSMFHELQKGQNKTVQATISDHDPKRESQQSRKANPLKTIGRGPNKPGNTAGKSTPKPGPSNSARDESRKRLLAEKRKAMKNQIEGKCKDAEEIQIFTPETNDD